MLLIDGLWNPLQVVQGVGKRLGKTRAGVSVGCKVAPCIPLSIPVHLQQPGERILHKENRLILHHLVILSRLSSLAIVARDDVQQHLLILGYRLALLRDKVLSLVTKLLVHTQRVGHC